jgi:phenylacetate-CoA ligase
MAKTALSDPIRSASRRIHRHIIFPAIVRARGEGQMFGRVRELTGLQWLNPVQLRQRQAEKLASLLNYAVEHSPYYAAAWGSGRRFDKDSVFEQLRGLPMISKSDLQNSQDAMLARPLLRRVSRKVTGGSTGEAVGVVKDREAIAAERAASWLAYGWFGLRMGDRGVRFWGEPTTLDRRFRFAASDFAMHRLRFSAFAFDDADLERYWARCGAFRPDYFYGYVSMLEALAHFVVRRGLTREWPGLKVVITTSEVLTMPQRELMKRAFGAPVQNEYGCGEVGPIAYDCPDGSLHLMTENQVVEVLRSDGTPAGPGESGDIVLTDLSNHAMPLIRYRVGDLAAVGDSCGCGRGFPVLQKVWGREYDIVTAPDGRRYHGEFFMYLFEDLRSQGAGVEKFQVIQHDADSLEVKLVIKDPGTADALEARVHEEFKRRLPSMETTMSRVSAIPPKPSGKSTVVENRWLKSGAQEDISAKQAEAVG